MTDREHMLDCLARFETLHSKMRQIARRTDRERKGELLSERRKVPILLGELRDTAECLVESGFNLAEFDSRYSDVRTILANHQSIWSVVNLDDTAGYLRSVQNVERAVDVLLEWTKKELARTA